jgi:hypothetical protein
MKSATQSDSPERPPAKDLCQMLDALEAGLVRLGRERDELRQTLDRVRRQLGPSLPTFPKRSNARQKRKPVNKRQPGRVKPLRKQSLDESDLQSAAPSDARKPARKTRQALGRTLAEIQRRKPHPPSPP